MNVFFSKIVVCLTIGVFIELSALAQTDCKDMKNNCEGIGEPYKYSGQSKSGYFELGQSSSFTIATYDGNEYSISLCAEKQLKGTFFRIKEYSADGTVLYDGQAEGDAMNQKQFFIEDSKPLYVEVVIPESEKPIEQLNYTETVGCVSVIVEYYKIGKKGFK